MEPRLGHGDGVQNEVLGTGLLESTEAAVDGPVKAFNLDIVQVHHEKVLKMLRCGVGMDATELRIVLFGLPLRAMHAPALLAFVVHEDHVGHTGGRNQVQVLSGIVQPDGHNVVPVPHHFHESVDVRGVFINILLSQ